MSDASPRYKNDRFVYELLSQGLRFVWPYQPQDAILLSEDAVQFSLSDEFILRVNNIRSFAMPADFLDKYQEFRGGAPQLEPSPTFYTPTEADRLEILYWKLVREKFHRNQDTPDEPYHQHFIIEVNDNTRAVTERRQKPVLAIQNLLNPSRSTNDP